MVQRPEEKFTKRNASLKDSICTADDLKNLLAVKLSDVDEVSTELVDTLPNHEGLETTDVTEDKKTHKRNVGKWTVLVFLNSGSGGGMGPVIYEDMIKNLGKEYVFDLKSCGKDNMPEDILTEFAYDPFVRVLVCGGDGTMGWILSSIDKVWTRILGENVAVMNTVYKQHLPIAMMPLGTGNDLSRMFKWGPKFSNSMRKPGMLTKVINGTPDALDRWRCVVIPLTCMSEEVQSWIPAVLAGKRTKDVSGTEAVKFMNVFSEGNTPAAESIKKEVFQKKWKKAINQVIMTNRFSSQSSPVFDGVFCNYASFGFIAKVAFAFHKERSEHPERFTSPNKNKMIYAQKTRSDGGLFHFRKSTLPPLLRGIIRVMVLNSKSGEMEEIDLPKNCRGVSILNIQSYCAGQKPISDGKYDDGLLELVFMNSLHHAASAITPFTKLTIAAQTKRLCIRVLKPVHCEVDGEPWLQSEGIFQISYFNQSCVLRNDKIAMNCCAV